MEAIPRPIRREVAAMDARWLNYEGGGLPSLAELALRWGWTSPSGRPSKKRVRLLLRDESAWRDPHQDAKGHSRGTAGAQQGHSRGTADTEQPPESTRQGHSKGTAGAQQGHSKGNTRVLSTPSPSPSTLTGPPKAPPGGSPQWAVKAARPKGVTPAELSAAVLTSLAAIKGGPVDPQRCATDAGAWLSLWRALGRPSPAELSVEVVLVAEWAQQSGDKAAARDIRAEGWDGGRDRSRSVSSLLVHRRWSERLEAAQRWDQAGRPHGSASSPGSDRGYYRGSGPDLEEGERILAEMRAEALAAQEARG